MTTMIQYTTRLTTDFGNRFTIGEFTLFAEVDTVRGATEVDLLEVHNGTTGEMYEMNDWDEMIDNYDGDWADDGVLCWRELQDMVWAKGE